MHHDIGAQVRTRYPPDERPDSTTDMTGRPPWNDVVRDRNRDLAVGGRFERDDKRTRLGHRYLDACVHAGQQAERNASRVQLAFRNQDTMTRNGASPEPE